MFSGYLGFSFCIKKCICHKRKKGMLPHYIFSPVIWQPKLVLFIPSIFPIGQNLQVKWCLIKMSNTGLQHMTLSKFVQFLGCLLVRGVWKEENSPWWPESSVFSDSFYVQKDQFVWNNTLRHGNCWNPPCWDFFWKLLFSP